MTGRGYASDGVGRQTTKRIYNQPTNAAPVRPELQAKNHPSQKLLKPLGVEGGKVGVRVLFGRGRNIFLQRIYIIFQKNVLTDYLYVFYYFKKGTFSPKNNVCTKYVPGL